ncbi:hypothetical protein NDU88_005828 [Pleurodeles waltl]|uniref:Uncharacterized protein n=1 Tax=Pleurodeles waltl TaxID=8319 RepID=A0AAV7WBM9_PLEWA|nr:hypothetical protein NDU88_005828 [Pleurodeles waltl]
MKWGGHASVRQYGPGRPRVAGYAVGGQSDALLRYVWKNILTCLRTERHLEVERRKTRVTQRRPEERELLTREQTGRKRVRGSDPATERSGNGDARENRIPARNVEARQALEGRGCYRYEIAYAVTYSVGHRGQGRYGEGLL